MRAMMTIIFMEISTVFVPIDLSKLVALFQLATKKDKEFAELMSFLIVKEEIETFFLSRRSFVHSLVGISFQIKENHWKNINCSAEMIIFIRIEKINQRPSYWFILSLCARFLSYTILQGLIKTLSIAFLSRCHSVIRAEISNLFIYFFRQI